MEFIAQRLLHDTDKQFINEIKKDMIIELINYIWNNYPEQIDERWFKHKYNISSDPTVIKLVITTFNKGE